MSVIKIGIQDIKQSFSRYRMVLYFSLGDIKSKYKRSVLGPLWLVLGTMISVVALGFIWSRLLNDDPIKLVPSLTVGLIVWQFLSGCIAESPSILYRNSHLIRNMPLPYFIFPMQLITRQFIYLIHNAIVIIAVVVYFDLPITKNQLLIIPGLLLVIGNLTWIILLISILGAKYRDLEQIIATTLPLFFFLSPVLYRIDQVKFAQEAIWLNPFSYFISLIRDPILNTTPPLFVYLTSVASFVVGSLIAIYYFGKYRQKIVFWL
jgi:ABC-type polysaccharide/polyol phosphate export permease